MLRPNWLGLWVVVLAVVAAGCENEGNRQDSADMRAFNAVVDAEALDVLIDDGVKASAIAFSGLSGYSNFDSGSRKFTVRSSVTGAVLSEKSVNFSDGTKSTMVLHGKRSALSVAQLSDDTATPSSGKFKARLLGLSTVTGAVDLYLTTTTDISSTPATLSGIGYGGLSDYLEVNEGTYVLTYASSSTKDIVFQSAARTYGAGTKATLAVYPSAGGKLANAAILTPEGVTTIPNPLARVKAVNAVADSSLFNFRADGATLLQNVPFMGTSSYVTSSSGARTLQLEASNVPGSNVATLAKTLDPAADYTIVAVNSLAQPELVVLTDDNTFPTTGYAKVRFVNALPGTATVDVLVNFAGQAAGIAYQGASSYQLLLSGTNYTLTFTAPGGITTLATLSAVELEAGVIYTAWLFGPASAPQAKLVRDR
jgi:hypothetical protein